MAKISKFQLDAMAKKANELEGRNPPTVVNAFLQKKYKIAGLDTMPLTMAHYVILEKIGSPFIDKNNGDFADLPVEDYLNVAFVITHSASESRELLAKGDEAFKNAIFEFSEGIDIADMKEVGIAIGITFAQAASTVLKTEKKTAVKK